MPLRELIPLTRRPLSRVIAPDLPGFGFTEVPAARNYTYTFEVLAKTIEAFTDALASEALRALHPLTTAPPPVSASHWLTPSASPPSSRKTETPTKKASATPGLPSSAIGANPLQEHL